MDTIPTGANDANHTGGAIPKPILHMQNREAGKRDEINFPDDATLRGNKAAGAYPKLKDFREEETK